MSLRLPPAALPLVLLTGALLTATTACGAGTQQAARPEPTVTVTTTEPPSSSRPAGVPASSSPRVTTGPGTGGEGTCTPAALRVRYADDPAGGAAGSVYGTFTFTNTSSGPCTLRGFPGVSFVTGSEGTQVGQAATRTDDEVSTKTLQPGKAVTAALRRTQPQNYGDSCDETKVTGFRVYAPGDEGAVFVPFPTTGCRSTAAPLLQVGPVR